MKRPIHSPRATRSVLEIATAAGQSAVSVNRQHGGRQAKRAGQRFEDDLELTHAAYERDGYGWFQRGHPATKRLRDGTTFTTGKNGVDFAGVYRGFAIAFDAKSHDDVASFAFKNLNDPKSSERNEITALQSASRAGALAFLLVLDPTRGRIYAVTSEHFAKLAAGGSIPLRRTEREGAMPLVPCFTLTTAERTLRAAQGRPVWPWPSLFPELCR